MTLLKIKVTSQGSPVYLGVSEEGWGFTCLVCGYPHTFFSGTRGWGPEVLNQTPALLPASGPSAA